MMLPTILLLVAIPGDASTLTGPEIIDRMVRADNERRIALTGYAGMRRYRFENKRFNKHAEMTVRVTCGSTGAKTFEVVEESGSGFVLRKVIQKMIDAEREASEKGEHEKTRIIPENYNFRFITTDSSDGRATYVFDISPKTNNRFLIRGRIWIDAQDFAIARVEGIPSKNPSFWIHHADVVQRYHPVGRFWLPAMNRSHAEAKVFGATDVEIDYFDYVANEPQVQVGQNARDRGRP